MEAFINPFQDLEPLCQYIRHIPSPNDQSNSNTQTLYFLEEKEDLGIFLMESKFVNSSIKANMIKNTKDLKILTGSLSQRIASSKGYALITERLRDLDLVKGTDKLSRIPDEIHTDT